MTNLILSAPPISFVSRPIISSQLTRFDVIWIIVIFHIDIYSILIQRENTWSTIVNSFARKKKKKEIKKALSNFFETTSSGPFLLGWKRREEKRGENFCWPARSWLERSVKAATPFSTYRVLSSLTKCPVCRAAMVLDLLPLHRQIRTCHGFIRSLVNDGGNTGGGSRQRRTVGDKSRFPTSAATQILRVCMCVYILLAIGAYFVKSRCQTNLIAERLDAMPS